MYACLFINFGTWNDFANQCLPSPPTMAFSEKWICSPSAVRKYLLKIILYLLSMESATWHYHVTVFVALNSGRQKSIVAISLTVRSMLWVFHIVVEDFLRLSFDIRLFIKIVQLMQLSNKIRKCLNFDFPLRLIIHPCSIWNWWLFLGFARFGGFKKFVSTLHSLFTFNILFLFICHLVTPIFREDSIEVTAWVIWCLT